ncbi:MAG: hypothetical protein PHZ00_04940 [Candidatus Peribacteraceae bacterium]|nr:hypothetical protein [Candidatus Peribacteraceae bacterium]
MCSLFSEPQFLCPEYFHALIQFLNDGRALAQLNFIHQSFDLGLEIIQSLLTVLPDRIDIQQPPIKLIEKIGFHDGEDGFARLEFREHLLKFLIYRVRPNAFVEVGTVLIGTAIVWVAVVPAFAPAACIGMMTAGTEKEATEGEIFP